MGRDNQPKHRQKARDIRRRAARTAPYKRVLIVCEGEKTEPLYLKEIRLEYRMSTANVQVWPSAFGTDPLNVVEHAAHLFNKGDRAKQIQPRAFDLLFAVFDRDEHITYFQALIKAKALDGRLKNDLGEPVSFKAIVSVPCFELWLLLHFTDIHAPIHRKQVYSILKCNLPGYEKGQKGHWVATKSWLDEAMRRAQAMAETTTADNGSEPYTDMHLLVSQLIHMRDRP
jgi:hypothetical protein